MQHIDTLCIVILKFDKKINNYNVYHIMSTNIYACWLTLTMSKIPNSSEIWIDCQNWNRQKVEFKNVIVHHVYYGTSTLEHLFMAHLDKEMLFLVLVKCSDKLCIYHHYYKGTSIRRLGHFECCKCFSTPIKGTTTKLLMITMPPKTLSCSSFCIPFKINMNTLCIFTVH